MSTTVLPVAYRIRPKMSLVARIRNLGDRIYAANTSTTRPVRARHAAQP